MLYIVGTPIGNLEDLSIRQAKTLVNSDVILTEDTRSTALLLNKIPHIFPHLPHLSNPPYLLSYYKEREFEKLSEVIELLEEGKTVSLVSQAGMPIISDPGSLLIQTVIKKNIPFVVIPGPTAFTTAFVYSGFDIKPGKSALIFLGFLPKQLSKLKSRISQISLISQNLPNSVFSFYESPYRINKTLKIINELMPEADICIGRELTKKFEEILRGKAKNLMNKPYKGELTVLLT